MDLYVLNKNLEMIGIVDTYKSLIWSNRYKTAGDCEVYVRATAEMFDLMQKDYYLIRSDDAMVCRIRKIELQTDVENGDYLIVTGKDTKEFLDQRIIWDTVTCDGNVESFIRSIVNKSLISASNTDRNLRKADGSQLLYLGSSNGFSEVTTEQISYANIGEKIREYCDTYSWGYRVIMDQEKLYFNLFKGDDRSDSVVFSQDYENLITTDYIDDAGNLGNVALVGGEGEGSLRTRNTAGSGSSTQRYEIFVDAKDISKNLSYGDLKETYPPASSGGQGSIYTSGGKSYYRLSYLDIKITSAEQLAQLQRDYPGGTILSTGYYRITNIIIADLESSNPDDGDTVTLRDVIYDIYLLNRGYEKLAEYGETITFNATVEPKVTFVYKQDYYLGDLVTIENEYGISVKARIVEIIEVFDDNGYSLEPKFEYKE